MRPVSLMRSFEHAIWILLLVACDSFAPEPPLQFQFSGSEYYILPGSSIVIDLKSVIKYSFTSVSLTISQDPLYGTLTQLDPFLLKYTPNGDFIQGSDKFVISADLDNGSEVRAETMKIFIKDEINEFPCGVYAVEDQGHVKANGVAILHPMDNDRICSVTGPTNVSIHLAPKFGEAEVSGDSIIYRPGPSYAGSDELVYRLSADGDQDVWYGIVSFQSHRIEILKIPPEFDDLFFVNENVGFITSVNGGMMKTNDGGEHWEKVNYHVGEFQSRYIGGIFFLDERTGFVLFTPDQWWDVTFNAGWMVTRDGGASWTRTNYDKMITSLFFTTTSKGFISTIEGGGDQAWVEKIFRTQDGGATWEEVATHPIDAGNLKIRFANEQHGYAFRESKIYATTDGGNSWTLSLANEHFGSFAVTRDNVICASISVEELNPVYAVRPGTIVRSENGATWTTVANLPYAVTEMGFSPSGDLGVATGAINIGNSYPEPPALNISTSLDKGNTWNSVGKGLRGLPLAVSIPSANVAYILCQDKLIRYTP